MLLEGKAPVRLFAAQPELCLLTFVMFVAPSVMQQQLVSAEWGEQAWKITSIIPARLGGTQRNRLRADFCIGSYQGRAKAGLGTHQPMNLQF